MNCFPYNFSSGSNFSEAYFTVAINYDYDSLSLLDALTSFLFAWWAFYVLMTSSVVLVQSVEINFKGL